jgi:hypothetical protein
MSTEVLGMQHRVFGMRHQVFARVHRELEKAHPLFAKRLRHPAMPHSLDRMRQPVDMERRWFDAMRRPVFLKCLCVLSMRLPEMKKALRVESRRRSLDSIERLRPRWPRPLVRHLTQGMLVDGKWQKTGYQTERHDGAFVRWSSPFRG